MSEHLADVIAVRRSQIFDLGFLLAGSYGRRTVYCEPEVLAVYTRLFAQDIKGITLGVLVENYVRPFMMRETLDLYELELVERLYRQQLEYCHSARELEENGQRFQEQGRMWFAITVLFLLVLSVRR